MQRTSYFACTCYKKNRVKSLLPAYRSKMNWRNRILLCLLMLLMWIEKSSKPWQLIRESDAFQKEVKACGTATTQRKRKSTKGSQAQAAATKRKRRDSEEVNNGQTFDDECAVCDLSFIDGTSVHFMSCCNRQIYMKTARTKLKCVDIVTDSICTDVLSDDDADMCS